MECATPDPGFRLQYQGSHFTVFSVEFNDFQLVLDVQGDTSRCSIGSVDMKTKVAFQYVQSIFSALSQCLKDEILESSIGR